jgi:hypothetical protein
MLPVPAAVPALPVTTTLGSLLGPVALLAAAAVLVALAVLIVGLATERRDTGDLVRMRPPAPVTGSVAPTVARRSAA